MNKKPFILIAEDDEEDRFLLTTAFDKIGHSEIIHFVDNGKELLGYLEIKHPENIFSVLIVLDIYMPDLDGIETLKLLKTDFHFRNIPVIILTTSANENEKKKCLNNGATEFITKPAVFHQ